jgi:hypothetical protein
MCSTHFTYQTGNLHLQVLVLEFGNDKLNAERIIFVGPSYQAELRAKSSNFSLLVGYSESASRLPATFSTDNDHHKFCIILAMTAHHILPKSSDTTPSSDIVASHSLYVIINLNICAVLGKLSEYTTDSKNIVIVMPD